MSKIKLNINGTILGKPVGGDATKWTLYDEATHRGDNYADFWVDETKVLLREEGMTLRSVMKEAYLQGFLHGFEHKFDQTNYEEK
jgi:hypothetical protein